MKMPGGMMKPEHEREMARPMPPRGMPMRPKGRKAIRETTRTQARSMKRGR